MCMLKVHANARRCQPMCMPSQCHHFTSSQPIMPTSYTLQFHAKNHPDTRITIKGARELCNANTWWNWDRTKHWGISLSTCSASKQKLSSKLHGSSMNLLNTNQQLHGRKVRRITRRVEEKDCANARAALRVFLKRYSLEQNLKPSSAVSSIFGWSEIHCVEWCIERWVPDFVFLLNSMHKAFTWLDKH